MWIRLQSHIMDVKHVDYTVTTVLDTLQSLSLIAYASGIKIEQRKV